MLRHSTFKGEVFNTERYSLKFHIGIKTEIQNGIYVDLPASEEVTIVFLGY